MAQMVEKSKPLHIRVRNDQRLLISQAAQLSTKTLSDFVRDSALKEAQRTLLDQTRFSLEPEAWEAFHAALDIPPENNPRLRDLLSKTPVWEK